MTIPPPSRLSLVGAGGVVRSSNVDDGNDDNDDNSIQDARNRSRLSAEARASAPVRQQLRFGVIGKGTFAIEVTKALIADGHRLVGVLAPEGDKLAAEAAKEGWENLDGALYSQLALDLWVSANNSMFVPGTIRDAAVHGAIGYHPSLLPRWRGNDAVRHTVSAGDPIAGGSVFWLDDGWDTGDIAAQDWCHVPAGWDASRLWRERLYPMGVSLIRQVVKSVAMGASPRASQDPDAEVTWAGRV